VVRIHAGPRRRRQHDGGTVEVETILARMDPAVVKRVAAEVGTDLTNGTWDQRYGHLSDLDELDVGMRLVVLPR
jgi:hypothetical protein